LVGELGIRAGDNVAGCNSFAERSNQIRYKVDAELTAGVVGVLMWDWVPDPRPAYCTFDIGANDPIRDLLRTER
jgi:mannan endo-1,4-beta-mannosidase